MLSSSSNDHILDAEKIRWCYRITLGRELENPEIIDRVIQADKTLDQLIKSITASSEFSSNRAIQRRQKIVPDKETRERAISLIAKNSEGAATKARDAENLNQVVYELLALKRHDRTIINGTEIILGKSLIRSGHHFMVWVLQEYFGQDFRYCEFYRPKNCCSTIPCTKPRLPDSGTNHYFMQKSHDFGMTDPLLPEFKHVIQYRHPIGIAQSGFEMAIKDDRAPEIKDDSRSFQEFLGKQAQYFIGFYRKYIHELPPYAVLTSYEELLSDTHGTLSRIVSLITGEEPDDDLMAKSIQMYEDFNVHSKTSFKPRQLDEHRFFDRALFAEIEDRVFAECPRLTLERQFA